MSLIYLLLALLLFSCNVGPKYQYPSMEIPESWKHEGEQEVERSTLCNWWEIFEDNKLHELIRDALNNNYDLRASIERVIQARAISGIKGSYLYPEINTTPYYNNEMFLTKAYGADALKKGVKIPLFREHLVNYSLPVNLNWEIDLWGRLKNIYCSTVYNAEAMQEAFLDLTLIITTDLADRYFKLRSLDQQIDLYVKTIKTRKKALRINQDRYDLQISSYDSVSEAMLDLANVEAEYDDTKRLRERLENSIATLIGIPSSLFFIEHNPLEGDPPPVLPNLPSEVLLHRPDVRERERVRAANHALVKAAYGAYFPSFSLTGAFGFLSPDFQHFLSWISRYWMMGAHVYQPIFDGGYLDSNLALEWAKFREADDLYRQIVLTALEEVNSSLSDIAWTYEETQKLEESVKSAKTTYRIAYDRYLEGIGYYLPVVDAERDQLNAERALNSSQGARFSATIQLIKALGGVLKTRLAPLHHA